MTTPIGNPQLIRNWNEYLVLNLIVSEGALSRAEISRRSGLSKPTVSSAAASLLNHRLIREIGQDSNQQGRKAQLLEFNPDIFHVGVAEFGPDYIRMGVADLSGRILETAELPLARIHPEELLGAFKEQMDGLLIRLKLTWDSMSFMSVGAPAVVHPDTGEVTTLLPKLEPFAASLSVSALSSVFPCKVLLDNDVNLAAAAEKEYGAARDAQHFVYVAVGEGVGAGIVINGAVHSGLGGAAGELGRSWAGMTAGNHEECSRLEHVVGAEGLRSMLRSAGSGTPESEEELFALAREGNETAQAVVEEYGRLLAVPVMNLSVLLAPEMIVLGGELGRHGDLYIPVMERELLDKCPVQPRLTVTELGREGVLRGAARTAVDRMFRYIRDHILGAGEQSAER